MNIVKKLNNPVLVAMVTGIFIIGVARRFVK